MVRLEVFEDGVPPRFRLRAESGRGWRADQVSLVTERPDGARQTFRFVDRDGYVESVEEIPEPHEFSARLQLAAGPDSEDLPFAMAEPEGHHHEHAHG